MIVNTQIRKGRRPALTLMEVMVVAAILVVLAGVGAISVLGYMSQAKEQSAVVGIKTLEDAVNSFYLNYKQYPENLQELTVQMPDGKPALLENKALEDPWGQPYQYEPSNLNPNTKKPRIYSNGEPGQNRQVYNW